MQAFRPGDRQGRKCRIECCIHRGDQTGRQPRSAGTCSLDRRDLADVGNVPEQDVAGASSREARDDAGDIGRIAGDQASVVTAVHVGIENIARVVAATFDDIQGTRRSATAAIEQIGRNLVDETIGKT